MPKEGVRLLKTFSFLQGKVRFTCRPLSHVLYLDDRYTLILQSALRVVVLLNKLGLRSRRFGLFPILKVIEPKLAVVALILIALEMDRRFSLVAWAKRMVSILSV